MKAISIGKRYEIYDDSLKAYDRLPAKTYTVRFEKMSGFFLEVRSDLAVKEKVYGIHPEKAGKVFQAFTRFERNLGVILSGDKGIGKSLFARLLSSKAVEEGYPVIIIDQFIPGIASYIESIEQEAVFLFDEFDKTFGSSNPKDNSGDPQSGLLSLFDGTSQGKKLFIITCNSLRRLNDFLVNRPGRFHYHFRFEYPSSEEIMEYLTDKLGPQYIGEIQKVILFSRKVALNFDCLRAIAFELSMGGSFETAIQDLNIINTRETVYDISLHFNDGTVLRARNCQLDMFDEEDKEIVELYDEKGRNLVTVEFKMSACVYDPAKQATVLPADSITLDYNEYYGEAVWEETKKLIPEYLSIVRAAERKIHYLTV
ncbi:AAA family ATPase [Lachnospiraceae bacterium]|nr:AAA family ATPase [Lachnospiraceae bacterium]